jgi:hypothetical protein
MRAAAIARYQRPGEAERMAKMRKKAAHPHTKATKLKLSKIATARYANPAEREKLAAIKRGALNPNWRNGKWSGLVVAVRRNLGR